MDAAIDGVHIPKWSARPATGAAETATIQYARGSRPRAGQIDKSAIEESTTAAAAAAVAAVAATTYTACTASGPDTNSGQIITTKYRVFPYTDQ